MARRLTQLQHQWEDLQVSKLQTFWICVAAVLATLIGGFGIGGWVSAGKAQQLVADAAQTARRELAVAVCVDEFVHSANAQDRLAKLKTVSFYERGDLVAAGGYATMPDRKEANNAVAAQCAAALDTLKQ